VAQEPWTAVADGVFVDHRVRVLRQIIEDGRDVAQLITVGNTGAHLEAARLHAFEAGLESHDRGHE